MNNGSSRLYLLTALFLHVFIFLAKTLISFSRVSQCFNVSYQLGPDSSSLLSTRQLRPQQRRFRLNSSNLSNVSSVQQHQLKLHDLIFHPRIPYKTLKLSLPSIYPNVDDKIVHQLARVFPRWPYEFPCFPAEQDWYTVERQRTPTDRGFLYFKARKAGSSTLAGVALRIAQKQAERRQPPPPPQGQHIISIDTNASHCHTRYGHPPAHRLKYAVRDRQKSFLWTILREPTHRDVSEFFHFGVSRGSKINPSKQSFQTYYESTPQMHEYYLQFMSTDRRYNPISDDYLIAVQKILSDYDFIGITERMTESLVVLQHLLNLTTSDILYLSAKQNGGWDDGLASQQCYYIHPSIISPPLQEYFQSNDWLLKKRGSNLLYATVNRSLDLTIASLNRDLFDSDLRRYRWALREVHTECLTQVRFPCSPGGVLQEKHDCVLWDSGCGHECLDRVARRLGL
jgi:hypothetical protein